MRGCAVTMYRIQYMTWQSCRGEESVAWWWLVPRGTEVVDASFSSVW
jgi:hypothetical protein